MNGGRRRRRANEQKKTGMGYRVIFVFVVVVGRGEIKSVGRVATVQRVITPEISGPVCACACCLAGNFPPVS